MFASERSASRLALSWETQKRIIWNLNCLSIGLRLRWLGIDATCWPRSIALLGGRFNLCTTMTKSIASPKSILNQSTSKSFQPSFPAKQWYKKSSFRKLQNRCHKQKLQKFQTFANAQVFITTSRTFFLQTTASLRPSAFSLRCTGVLMHTPHSSKLKTFLSSTRRAVDFLLFVCVPAAGSRNNCWCCSARLSARFVVRPLLSHRRFNFV